MRPGGVWRDVKKHGARRAQSRDLGLGGQREMRNVHLRLAEGVPATPHLCAAGAELWAGGGNKSKTGGLSVFLLCGLRRAPGAWHNSFAKL